MYLTHLSITSHEASLADLDLEEQLPSYPLITHTGERARWGLRACLRTYWIWKPCKNRAWWRVQITSMLRAGETEADRQSPRVYWLANPTETVNSRFSVSKKKKKVDRAGELIQCLRMPTVLVEDPSSSPSIHTGQLIVGYVGLLGHLPALTCTPLHKIRNKITQYQPLAFICIMKVTYIPTQNMYKRILQT